jgi:FMN phosphatase YigB (HAD superfamily)
LLVDDLAENLDAARALGMRTALIARYDPAIMAGGDHPVLTSLDQLAAVLDARPALS